MDHQRQVRRLLGRGHAQPAHFFGQLGQRLRNAVLHLDLRQVDIGAELESYRQRHHAVRCRLREHIEGMFNTVDRLLERRRDSLSDGLRIRARIGSPHDDSGRNNLRIFADRQSPHRDHAHQENPCRKDARENRAADEKVCEFHIVSLVCLLCLRVQSGLPDPTA